MAASSLWPEGAVAVVTGSSTGIGFEIVRGLAKHGIPIVVLTARNIENGHRATEILHEQGLSNVVFHQLDITDSKSVDEFSNWIKQSFKGIDILVNNAAVSSNEAIKTNYYGTKLLTTSLLENCMRSGSRIINVSTSGSRLDLLTDESWKQKLQDSENITEELIEQFLEEFSKPGNQQRMFQPIKLPIHTYSASKMSLNAYSQLLARQLQPRSITVNSFCPGHTSTRLTFNTGHEADAGADTGVWLATANKYDLSTGQFYVERKRVNLQEIPLSVDGKMIHSLKDWISHGDDAAEQLKHLIQEDSRTP